MNQLSNLRTLRDAVVQLCSGSKVQSGMHIRSLQQFCATRLVVEGGFRPEWISPCPPLRSTRITNARYALHRAEKEFDHCETRVLGGIKYKDIDVTVVVPDVGPALAISTKSTGNAFRNLTNRMEEALGECTNIHLMYPGFVFGFLHLIKFNKVSQVPKPDASFSDSGEPLPAITRYHEVLASLAGRTTITDPGMRYEAVGLLVYVCKDKKPHIWHGFPPEDSPVHFGKFFQRLYDMYDLRYGYPDPDGPNIRKEWQLQKLSLPAQFDREMKFPWSVRTESEI